MAEMFNAHYYATGCGRPYGRDEVWLNFFGSIAERIVNDIRPASVLDAGCAWGFLVEALRQRGVEAFGVDISEYAIQNVHPDVRPYCWQGSAAEPLPRSYDLIVCIEVLEHMSPAEAEKAVQNFCRHSRDVLFSSTPFDYKEATHFNVQPPEYWAELFARGGFFRDVDYDATFITPWAARFRARQEPAHRLVRDYERRFFLLVKENADLRSLVVEQRNEIDSVTASYETRVAELDRALSITDSQLQEILESRSWKWIQKLQGIRLRLFPLGSARERMLYRLLGRR